MEKDDRELACSLFALMTRIAEDAHELAVYGQSPKRKLHAYLVAANRLRRTADALGTLANAAMLIAATPDAGKIGKPRTKGGKAAS